MFSNCKVQTLLGHYSVNVCVIWRAWIPAEPMLFPRRWRDVTDALLMRAPANTWQTNCPHTDRQWLHRRSRRFWMDPSNGLHPRVKPRVKNSWSSSNLPPNQLGTTWKGIHCQQPISPVDLHDGDRVVCKWWMQDTQHHPLHAKNLRTWTYRQHCTHIKGSSTTLQRTQEVHSRLRPCICKVIVVET